MPLIFKRNFPNRSNPYRKRATLSENDQGENNGRNKSSMKNEGKENLTKKKRLHEDSDGKDEDHMAADEKLSKTDLLSSEDEDLQDSDNESERDKIDAKSNTLAYNQTDNIVPDDINENIICSNEDGKWQNKGHEMDEIYAKTLHYDRTDNKVPNNDNNLKHLPTRIPATEKKKWPQKPCVLCRKFGTRRDTRYFCSSCDIALCKSPCFSEYHSCK